MLKRLFALAAAAAALSGCVLQSRAPLYDDAVAEMVLGARSGQARIWERRDGAWVEDGETVAIAVSGRHYVASVDDDRIVLLFVRLDDDWLVLQAGEINKPFAYMLAKTRDGGADIWPLGCSDLKKAGGLTAAIEFTGDDCFIRPGSDSRRLFAALAAQAGEPSSRIAIAR